MMEYEQPWSAKGRIRRSVYWLRWLLASVLIFLVEVLFQFSPNAFTLMLMLLVTLPATVFLIIQGVKRMHDVNKSGWFILVPFYNLVLALTDGVAGRNIYGADPKERSEQMVCPQCGTLNEPFAESCQNCQKSFSPPDAESMRTKKVDNALIIIVSFIALNALLNSLIHTYVDHWFAAPTKYFIILLNVVSGCIPVLLGILISNPRLKIIALILAAANLLNSIIVNIQWFMER